MIFSSPTIKLYTKKEVGGENYERAAVTAVVRFGAALDSMLTS